MMTTFTYDESVEAMTARSLEYLRREPTVSLQIPEHELWTLIVALRTSATANLQLGLQATAAAELALLDYVKEQVIAIENGEPWELPA